MAEHVLSGDQLAWTLLTDKEPGMICKLAEVQHDFAANKFTVQSFGQEIFVDPTNYTITSNTALGEELLHGLGHFLIWRFSGISAGQKISLFPVGSSVRPA